jgi:hypothetical protein
MEKAADLHEVIDFSRRGKGARVSGGRKAGVSPPVMVSGKSLFGP